MVPPTTRPTAGVLAVLLLTAGCLSGLPAGTPDATPTAGGTPNATDATPTDWHSQAAASPDPHHEVTVENDWNRSVRVHVRVIRTATNETVHEANHTVPARTEQTVYDLARADPDGVEEFAVVATARNETERVTVETSECYGDVHATVYDDGGFHLVYAIC